MPTTHSDINFWAYVYFDPKTNIPIYVGKGVNERPFDHLQKCCKTRLGYTLRKRTREGFNPKPILIQAATHDDAVEMEMLLIAMIGREDLGNGTLFNLTDGGEGCIGRKRSEDSLKKQSDDKKKFYENELARETTREATKKTWETRPRTFKGKRKQCTVDGIIIYDGVAELIKALGQGKKGYLSPSFRYIETKEEPNDIK